MSNNKLRFKDNNGLLYPTWNSTKLLEEAKVYQPQTIQQKDFSDDGYNVFGANGIIGKYKKYNHEEPQIAIACRGNTCGTINYTTPFSWITGNAMVINVDDNKNINKEYLLHFMGSINFNEYISGSGQPQITRVALSNLEIALPSLPEQEKIAALFSKLDERIELREQKLAGLKEYKKGLQQAVFGNNGERTLHFKDSNGKNYPDWVLVKLSGISKIKSSGDLSKIDFKKSKDEKYIYPVYGNGITNAGLLGYSNKYEYNNAVTVTGRGDIGITFIRETPFVAVGRLLVLTADSNLINNKFLQEAVSLIKIISESTGVPQLTAPSLGEYEINVPCLEEQEKIANLFSKIDNQIELEEALLQAAKDEKQGLMQRVF